MKTTAESKEQRVKRRQRRSEGASPQMTGNTEEGLRRAAKKGDVVSVKLLLEQGADVNAVDKDDMTALHHASARGRANIVKLLLEAGGDLFALDKDDMTALHHASFCGRVAVVKMLLAKTRRNVDAVTKDGMTSLYLATLNSHAAVIEALLEDGGADADAICRVYEEKEDERVQRTALHVAAIKGQREVVEVLLNHDASVGKKDGNGSTALHLACENNHASVVKTILRAQHLDVNIEDEDGWAPLHVACRSSDTKVVFALLDAEGIEINDEVEIEDQWIDMTPLHLAVIERKVSVVKRLSRTDGVDINATCEWRYRKSYIEDPGGWIEVMKPMTALHLAVRGGHVNVVDALLTAESVDVNANVEEHFTRYYDSWDEDGQQYGLERKNYPRPGTALHMAIRDGKVEVVRALLRAQSVDVNAVHTEEGWTPLHYASQNGLDALVSIFVTRKDVKLLATDQNGWSSLHHATANGHHKVVDIFLKIGVVKQNIDAKTNEGYTALHCAVLNGHIEVIDALVAVSDVVAHVNARDNEGKTPLHRALTCPGNYMHVVTTLTQIDGVELMAQDKDGNTVLHLAARRGDIDAVARLGVNDERLINLQNSRGEIALHLANSTEVAKALIGLADLTILDRRGNSVLHLASRRHQSSTVALLLSYGCSANALNRNGKTPLYLSLQSPESAQNHYGHDEVDSAVAALETVYELMSHGAVYSLHEAILPENDESTELASNLSSSFVKKYADIILMCVLHWSAQQGKNRALAMIPSEIVRRGSKRVKTYLRELEASGEEDLECRHKVCVVGSSRAGKTSMLKSILSMATTLEEEEDRTIGVDLSELRFTEDIADGETAEQRSHVVKFWDFAGQDQYHVAHTLFFSRRTLYLLCVDVEEFDQVVRDARAGDDGAESQVVIFVQKRVWHWFRLIFARQPDAEFVLIATKTDTLAGDAQPQLKDLESELIAVVENLKQTYKGEIQREIDALVKRSVNDKVESSCHARIKSLQSLQMQLDSSVPTSWTGLNVRKSGSIQRARTFVEDVAKQSGRTFVMPDKYSRVLSKVEELRQNARKARMKNRVRQSFVSLPDLVKVLMADIHDLTEDDAITILETLHDLGDVLWYARDGHHMLGDTVILDAELLIDFIRQIVCHDPTKISRTDNADDDDIASLVHAMNQHGTVSNKLLRHSFSLWKRLAYPDQLLQFMLLLQHFNLAYPAGGDVMQADSDLVVPAYWRVRGKQIDLSRVAPLSVGDIDSSHTKHFLWEYYLGDNSADVVDTVFDQLVVRSYDVFPNRVIHGRCVESVQEGSLAIRIACGMVKSRGPVIQLEVLGKIDHDPSGWLRDVHMAIEDVLKLFPGILVAREAVAGRHSCNLDKCLPKWRGLSENQREAKLREHSWLPNGVVEWFRRTDGGVRDWFIPPESIVKHKGPAFAAGAFGAVYLAKWQHTDVVVKEMLVSEMRRFLKEVTHWYGLRHDNVVRFLGANDKKEPYFIVSSYAAGGELLSFLSSEKENGREVVWRKLYEAAAGLSHLHRRGIVHGDLKGNNIVVGKDGTAMIADFGLSFSESGSSSVVTEKKDTLGTMAWRAPEFADLTVERPTRKSDVFSLGMCIVEAIKGGNPWCRKSTTCPRGKCNCWSDEEIRKCLRSGDVKVTKPDAMTKAQWELVEKMIAPSPSDRPELSEVIAKLADFAEEEERVALEKENPYG